MSTATAHLKSIAVAAAFLAAVTGSTNLCVDDELLEGRAPTQEELRPSVEAAFRGESVNQGTVASLVLFNTARKLTVQVFRTGPEHTATVGNSELRGIAVTSRTAIGAGRPGRVIRIRIGNWPSGVYFARLTAADGRVGFAPIVVAPAHLGAHRVAVVEPTLTWQAYNLRDDNGDGKGDSWYARWTVRDVRLDRPYLNRGVPYNFRRYDLPFLHWLAWTGRGADYLSDADLEAADPRALARAYDLIIFPGHHEYVTTREYAAVVAYRDLGGNLAYLSANNFFWQLVRHGRTIERTSEWRDLDRPEAALIGAEYRGNDRGGHRGPWIVRDRGAAPWLFVGTHLMDGSTFGSGGIEIDKTCSNSPSDVHVLAEIPDLFGPGFTAQMTYYETSAGAKVFAAGAFTLAGSVLANPTVGQLVANLWAKLSRP
jgi:hypothetical protein